MIIITGEINEETTILVRQQFPDVIVEPTQNMSLFNINGLANDLTDNENELIVWTNHPELLSYIGSFFYAVDEDDLVIKKIDTDKVLDLYGSIGLIEVITRNWHFDERVYV